jgi:hypothetical protein
MQNYIQSVHIKLFYFTIKLQFNTHLTYYSHNNQKDLQLNLDRALGGQLIKMDYLLKTIAESIGNNRGSVDRIGKEGSCLLCLRKSADFRLKDKLAGAVSMYDPRGLVDLGSPEAKPADMERNVEGTVLQVQKKEGSCRLDLVISMFLSN